jgi:hypothetical protein
MFSFVCTRLGRTLEDGPVRTGTSGVRLLLQFRSFPRCQRVGANLTDFIEETTSSAPPSVVSPWVWRVCGRLGEDDHKEAQQPFPYSAASVPIVAATAWWTLGRKEYQSQAFG